MGRCSHGLGWCRVDPVGPTGWRRAAIDVAPVLLDTAGLAASVLLSLAPWWGLEVAAIAWLTVATVDGTYWWSTYLRREPERNGPGWPSDGWRFQRATEWPPNACRALGAAWCLVAWGLWVSVVLG